ncbi:MAG: hypothetical protein KDK70_17305 [Myxococcales bacterium]|nr:hypothetical protein [Myxococcales bacterium]
MLGLAFLLAGSLGSAPSFDQLTTEPPPLCDDGSSARNPDGTPNWSCSRQGCSAEEALCWDYRLDHCYGADGEDLGVCVIEVAECSGRLACFDMWLFCAGEYNCVEDGVIGCTKGTCSTDTSGKGPDPDDLTHS